MTHAVIALGSNLGDRLATLNAAVDALRAHESMTVLSVSRWLESIPHTLDGVDPSKPRYLNGVLILDTALDPHDTLAALRTVEGQFGRPSERAVWADRTLDLDIIVFGEERIHDAELTIPHPRAQERVFVLQPWLELDPAAVIPGVGLVADLIQLCPEAERAALTPLGESS